MSTIVPTGFENILTKDISALTFRLPEGVDHAFTEWLVMDMNRPFNIANMRKVYVEAYINTGKMYVEEMDTYLGYLAIAGSSATFKEYSALIRSPSPQKSG